MHYAFLENVIAVVPQILELDCFYVFAFFFKVLAFLIRYSLLSIRMMYVDDVLYVLSTSLLI